MSARMPTRPPRKQARPPRSQAELPPIKVRREPPTITEAVVAAQGLSDDPKQQVAIAAGLMGLPEEVVAPEVLKARPLPPERIVNRGSGAGGARVVMVERKGTRSAQRLRAS